jgi:hypothetical protein
MPGPTLDAFLASFTPAVRALALEARALILDVHPGATERVWPGWKNVGYGTGPSMGEMVCAVAPVTERISVNFARGTELPDPAGLLEGQGKRGRHVKLANAEALRSPAFRALLEAAFATATEPRTGPAAPAPNAYQVGGSKTVAVPVERLYAAWTDEALRRRWLPDAALVVRKATPYRSLRVTWSDGSSLDVLFYAKGEGKSQVAVDHRKLPDSAIEPIKAYWKERLAALARVLAPAAAS